MVVTTYPALRQIVTKCPAIKKYYLFSPEKTGKLKKKI